MRLNIKNDKSSMSPIQHAALIMMNIDVFLVKSTSVPSESSAVVMGAGGVTTVGTGTTASACVVLMLVVSATCVSFTEANASKTLSIVAGFVVSEGRKILPFNWGVHVTSRPYVSSSDGSSIPVVLVATWSMTRLGKSQFTAISLHAAAVVKPVTTRLLFPIPIANSESPPIVPPTYASIRGLAVCVSLAIGLNPKEKLNGRLKELDGTLVFVAVPVVGVGKHTGIVTDVVGVTIFVYISAMYVCVLGQHMSGCRLSGVGVVERFSVLVGVCRMSFDVEHSSAACSSKLRWHGP